MKFIIDVYYTDFTREMNDPGIVTHEKHKKLLPNNGYLLTMFL